MEAIRRHRNDSEWGQNDPTELQKCWGMGPTNTAEGGYGRRLLQFLNTNNELSELMNLARHVKEK